MSCRMYLHNYVENSGSWPTNKPGQINQQIICPTTKQRILLPRTCTTINDSRMAESSMKQMYGVSADAIDRAASELHTLSKEIWNNPELHFKEFQAHDNITNFLSKFGFSVQRNYLLDTAFHGEFGQNGPTVAILCEYDALPSIGHACGHNLITEVGAAAAIGVKAALEERRDLSGKVVVLGTPAEEDGGGKATLLEKGAFSDCDCAIMAHPGPFNATRMGMLAIQDIKVQFHGKTSHACAYPWDGVNALDAAVQAYANISCLRQQFKPTWRVNGVITKGGEKANMIPSLSEMEYSIRASTRQELECLNTKITKCFQAAATATGCRVEMNYAQHPYYDVVYNSALCETFEKHWTSLGIKFDYDVPPDGPRGSTDMGNVSYVLPTIHPVFYIGSDERNHTPGFTTAAGAEVAQSYTLTVAKAIAMTALDVLSSSELRDKMKSCFDQDMQDRKNVKL